MADRIDAGVKKNLLQWGTTVSFTLGWFAAPPDLISNMTYGTAAMVLYLGIAFLAAWLFPRVANIAKGWLLVLAISLIAGGAVYLWDKHLGAQDEQTIEATAGLEPAAAEPAADSEGG